MKKAAKDITRGTGVTVTYKSGHKISGVYLGRHDDAVWISVDGGETGVDAAAILSITPSESDESVFLKWKAGLDPKDVVGWWNLSLWAQEKNLPGYAQSTAQNVLYLQPDHAEARAFFGQEKVNGSWMTYDDAKRARGFMLYRGNWIRVGTLDKHAKEAAQERIDRSAH
ncbi:MAG: hypothetical protein ABL955_01840 [Elusimicrobiota bacterium]